MSSDAAAQFNIHDAKTNLSRIIDRVEARWPANSSSPTTGTLARSTKASRQTSV